MKVRIRFERLLNENSKTATFIISGRVVTLSKDDFTLAKRSSIITEREFAQKRGFTWKLLFHIPPHIKPKYNQVCLDELRC